MKIRPLYDRIVVKRIEQQRQTASGIVIPDAAAEKPEQGEVLAVGQGKRNADDDEAISMQAGPAHGAVRPASAAGASGRYC